MMGNYSFNTPTLYWSPPKRDGMGGYIWETPIEIKCKWDYKPDIDYVETGATIKVNASVWSTHKVVVGGYFWKGTIKEVTDFKNPYPDTDFTRDEYLSAKTQLDKLVVTDLGVPIVKVIDIPPLSAGSYPYPIRAFVG